jgi:hypothetical protein
MNENGGYAAKSIKSGTKDKYFIILILFGILKMLSS